MLKTTLCIHVLPVIMHVRHVHVGPAGMDNMSHVSSRSQMSVEPAVERETRTLVVKDVNPDVSDAEFKQLFEVGTLDPEQSL